MARILKLAYLMRAHRFGPWALDRWAATAAWGAGAIVLSRWVLIGRPVLPSWHWLALALLVMTGIAMLALRVWAARSSYVAFAPAAARRPPEPCALAPADKVAVWVTGRFEVEGRAAFFADLQAFWRTFATREHAIMAVRHRSTLPLLGEADAQVGMWYIFMQPSNLTQVTAGWVAFGAARGPGLRVIYQGSSARRGKQEASQALVRQIVYLRFDDELARDRVWADLIVTE